MKILVHDFAGHPYAVQLSRALARRGHEVLHVYSGSNPMPQGTLRRLDGDPAGFQIQSILLEETINKAKLLKRRQQDLAHGKQVAEVVRSFKPDVVISGSTPLDTQSHIWRACQGAGVSTVFWLQDITGVAINMILGKRIPVLGKMIGGYYERLEERLLRESDAIVAISEDFIDVLGGYGVHKDRVHVVENWGPMEEVPVCDKQNPWAIKNGLDQSFNFVYSGSLGMKHDPELLVRLAQAFQTEPNVKVVVVTEGIGRRWLETKKYELKLDNLVLMDFQPFAEVPMLMGSADVLMAILEPAAGVFSVPSKVYSYLCAKRPLLLSVPAENLAARIVQRIGAGLVSDAKDAKGFIANARKLHADSDLRAKFAEAGRSYAEQTYQVDAIAGRFLEIFEGCHKGSKEPLQSS
jgi:colanic acid biosynthesis glycosyl transferase WcaI